MSDDLRIIKEDAIRTQEAGLLDTIKSIELENNKSSFALIFASALLAIPKDFEEAPLCIVVLFLVLTIGSIIIAFYNISAKKVSVHANVDEIFVKNTPKEWGIYLNNKHLFLRNAYQEAKNLLYKKVLLTKASFVFIVLSVILISLVRVFYGL